MTRRPRPSERGFTLAALLVLITIIMVFVAYTVPRQWSQVMARERDRQTIFIMKQYARAIAEWQRRHGGLPTSLEQLKEAKSPRFIRGPKGELACPLTGEVDWILIPPAQGQQPQGGGAGIIQGSGPGGSGGSGGGAQQSPWRREEAKGVTTAGGAGSNPQQSNAPFAQQPGGLQRGAPKDYIGPFVGVRPNKSGQSFLAFNNAESYEQWSYTVQDLQNEINARNAVQAQFK